MLKVNVSLKIVMEDVISRVQSTMLLFGRIYTEIIPVYNYIASNEIFYDL